MSEAAHDTDLCLRVISRRGVKAGDLAREAMVAESMLSRYLSGQFMLPLRVFAALWRMTRDPELLALLAADGVLVVPVNRADIHHGVAESAENHGEPGCKARGADQPLRRQARPPFFAAHPRGVTA